MESHFSFVARRARVQTPWTLTRAKAQKSPIMASCRLEGANERARLFIHVGREREEDFPCIIVDGNPFMFEIYARVKSGMHQTLNT